MVHSAMDDSMTQDVELAPLEPLLAPGQQRRQHLARCRRRWAPEIGWRNRAAIGPDRLCFWMDPNAVHLAGKDPRVAGVEAELQRRGSGIDNADKRFRHGLLSSTNAESQPR